MLANVLIVAAAVAVAFVVFVATRPSTFRVVRSATFAAPPPAVFAQVNDFHKWEAWSPWAKRDPAAKNAFEGSPAGEGAVFRWDGNREVGAGSMLITESRPSDLIRIKLDFVKPFPGTNAAEFTFKPEGDRTNVTWSMAGNQNFFCKAFGLFMNMDKMIGRDFEQGLANMKVIAEAAQ